MSFKFELKHEPVRISHYGQTIRKLEDRGCYTTPEAIEARGSMQRLMKRKPRRRSC